MATDKIHPAEIATVYVNYLKAFLKRADVQNGTRVSYHDNQDPDGPLKPENWVNLGDARVTTGFCVSFSNAILHDTLFQELLNSRNALAKLISIDIKEQYYGYCKPSYIQNKWHTAILVRDNDVNLILDPTCAQFGNQFVGKFVWDFETWIRTFRSVNDTHEIIGFDKNLDKPLSFSPISTNVTNYDTALIAAVNALHDITTITDTERRMLADFFLKGIELFNRKLDLGNLTDNDFKYIENINRLTRNFTFCIDREPKYFVMGFDTFDASIKWLRNFNKKEFILPYYMILSNSIEDSCNYFGIEYSDINKESTDSKTYVILKFVDCMGNDVSNILKNASIFVPYGIKTYLKNLYNSGKSLTPNSYGIQKKTNTIIVELSMES